jgi:hypothetical protein
MAIIRFIFGQDFVDAVCCTRSIRYYYDYWNETDAHTFNYLSHLGAAFHVLELDADISSDVLFIAKFHTIPLYVWRRKFDPRDIIKHQ